MTASNLVPLSRYSAVVENARGMAVIAVVFLHSYIWILAPSAISIFHDGFIQWWTSTTLLEHLEFVTFDFGFLGVNLFFVISGYCIHISNAAAERSQLNIRAFLLRRMARIYPLYLVMVLILFCLYGFITHQWVEKGINLQNFLGHIFFWHYQGHPAASGMGISGVMWTLAIEVQFYLFYALFFGRILAFGLKRLTILMLVIEIFYRIGSLVIWNDTEWLHPVFAPSRFAPARFGEWLLGAWLAERVVKGRLSGIYPALAIGSGVSLILFGMIIGSWLGLDKYNSTDLPAAIGFFLILHGLLSYEQAGARFEQPVLKWLGERSYSIYLVHATVLLALATFTTKTAHRWTAAGLTESWFRMFMFILSVLIALSIAQLAYLVIERPSHRLARSLS